MNETKYLKCSCSACGGHIEYPAEAAGTTIACPHCRFETELSVEAPDLTPELPPGRWRRWVLVGLVALGLAGAIAPLLLKRAASRRPAPVLPTPVSAAPLRILTNDFEITALALDREQGPSLVYAVGTVRNMLGKQRFGVKVDLHILDAGGNTIGTASDYTAVIEPKGKWQFKAMALKKNGVSAQLVAIREQ